MLTCRFLGPGEEWGRGSAFISSPQVEWMLLAPNHMLGRKGMMENALFPGDGQCPRHGIEGGHTFL